MLQLKFADEKRILTRMIQGSQHNHFQPKFAMQPAVPHPPFQQDNFPVYNHVATVRIRPEINDSDVRSNLSFKCIVEYFLVIKQLKTKSKQDYILEHKINIQKLGLR